MFFFLTPENGIAWPNGRRLSILAGNDSVAADNEE
jgi:hypothetical protein